MNVGSSCNGDEGKLTARVGRGVPVAEIRASGLRVFPTRQYKALSYVK
jgi:ribosomal protein L13E